MAAKKVTFLTFSILFIWILPDASLGVQQGQVLWSRLKRQSCQNGEYEHDGRKCCLCSAGQHLVNHCTLQPDDGSCDYCERGLTYSPHPNSQPTCQSCTSCSQPNANLEEAEPCTVARDRVCRCKEGHYCPANAGVCKICQPCSTCDPDGVKEPCTATSDAVCNEAQGSGGIIAASILVPLLVLSVLGGIFYYWYKKRKAGGRNPDEAQGNGADGNGVSVVMEPLNVPNVDLLPFLPDIAEELGWTTVEHLAMRSGMKEGVISSCKLDNPGDSGEQTLQLLKRWVELHGKSSSTQLVQSLWETGKKATAEKVLRIISGGNSET